MKRLLKVYNLSSKNMCEKLVGWKSLFTELSILVFREMQKLFFKFRAPHKEQDRTCCLAGYYLELM